MSEKKRVRAAFRLAVFRRDGFRCAACGVPGRDRQGGVESPLAPLDAHHITDRDLMPNGGYVVENGISLCDGCHAFAERFHQTGTAAEGFSPDELYALIGSNHQAAVRASERLA